MKTIILNIIGFIVGCVAFFYLFPIIMHIITYIISIPVLGDILRFGTEPAYIVFPYSVFANSAISAGIAYYICPRNKKQRKIGLILLGIVMIPAYANTTISLFRNNGYEFVFVVFALCAIICVFLTMLVGFVDVEN